MSEEKRDENIEEKKEEKKIEIVSGDGKDLNISPVYDHLEIEKPKKKIDQEIVIPKVKKDEKKK